MSLKTVFNENLAKLLLRFSIGGMMLPHGIFKIQNGMKYVEGLLLQAGLPYWMAPGVLIGEIIAPMFLILGFWSRLAGLGIAGTMGMAIFLGHTHELSQFSPHTGGWSIELNVLFLVGGAVCALLGSGHWSLSRGSGLLD